MRWENRKKSDNVEDRRGQRAPSRIGVGGSSPLLRLLPALIRRGGIKGLLVIVAGLFIASQLGINIPALLTGGGVQTAPGGPPPQVSPAEQKLADFTAVVLADTETTWHEIFKSRGRQYEEPKLVLFSGSVRSACGFAQAAMGPFYCPGDKKVYIDLSFYNDLRARHGAPGDFAQAYVIAHEVGHHIQTVLGISEQVHRQKQRASKAEANQLSVRQELQADCLAGVWGHHADRTRSLLEQGDLEEALRAAAAIGDDRLQQQSRGYVTPESFTHGSSEQRIRWFRTGFQRGDIDACDTFKVAQL